MSILHLHGTRAGENYIKHLEDRIWQLRPVGDCLLFASIIRGKFVLLHYFAKQNYRIPKREIERAKVRLADLQERIKDEPIGSSWTSFEQEIFDESEIAETQFRIRLILEIIETRQQLGISQRKLEKLSGVKQSMIARVEKGSVNPSLATVLKLLVPLGKTLQIVPLDKNKTVR
ncbi:hypothetical protein AP460_01721 [Actinobacillus pleuropneumoniae]|nr:hypothetical protein AP518_01674 [Actinobacillus pleuropneumoniae]KIE90063.1 hypothetical protein AP460_01721 [Actinobacillus pleuropneumoniae]KIE90156.1 hypothetical protein AP1022_01585 [Actinobacillus pleuropneumoniae]KIE96004.1 hypothetical protein AP5651_01678 [Actinobacillus pleuropneumoniae]KIE96545.1 hypothetical protein AP780_01765 [Actinobacillus pleuropneumoniae]